MNNLDDAPRQSINLRSLLPIMMIAMIFVGSSAFFAVAILPAWQDHEALAAEVDSGRDAAIEHIASQSSDGDIEVLEIQIARIQSELDTSAAVFLTELQAEGIIDSLYTYARISGVSITTLQTQQTTTTTTTSSKNKNNNNEETETFYTTREFRLQVDGTVAQLMNFVARIREASLSSVHINNLNIAENNAVGTLVMDVVIYTSPYADGMLLSELPVGNTPTPIPPTPTPSPTVDPAAAQSDTSASATTDTAAVADSAAADSSRQVADDQAVIDATATALASDPEPDFSALVRGGPCPGTPGSLFKVGDAVVVDFNGGGALNILTYPRIGTSTVEVRAQAFDNESYVLQDGPVCGNWEGKAVWYWYINRRGIKGWVGEATLEDRWLCPHNTPECAW